MPRFNLREGWSQNFLKLMVHSFVNIITWIHSWSIRQIK
jgi:hypothetical protein